MDTPTKPDPRYGWYVVGVLILAYIFSYVDRTILTLMVGPIRASLNIGDVEVSLLHGLAFAIFYTLLGLPIGRLVDRRRRTTIIAVGIAIWSLMTALCGLARNFTQMFLARIGVGVGEAALSPAAYSIIADYFDGSARTRALSVYNAAIYIGAGLALVLAGQLIALIPPTTLPVVGALEPWRVIFLLVGVPGLVLSLWTLTLREPERRSIGNAAVGAEVPLSEIAAHLKRHPATYALMIGGFSAGSLMWNGTTFWIAEHFVRSFGWTKPEIGFRVGLALLTAGGGAAWTGGWLAGRLRDRGDAAANLKVGMLSALVALPAGVIAPLLADGWASFWVYVVFIFAGALPYGPAAAAFQDITPNRMRGVVTALYLFILNLAGIGLGPTIVAGVAQAVWGGDAAISLGMSAVVGFAGALSAILLGLGMARYRRTATALGC